MEVSVRLAFVGASLALLVVPGPTLLPVIGASLAGGRGRRCRSCSASAPAISWRRARFWPTSVPVRRVPVRRACNRAGAALFGAASVATATLRRGA
jgi:hypothetical protein